MLYIPVGFALVGWLLGQLIRGRRPRIEKERPRLALSTAYLRDAHNRQLSNHTRVRCTFESVYFCCCEIADTHGLSVAGMEHPSNDVVTVALSAMNASNDDRQAVKLLADWATDANPSLPSVTVKDACKLAERVHAKTVSMLS
ncbi:hypothetical protein FAZ95_03030 [Trinickia violacea]|uniref:Uncharacterized protein n=2 Tax=Trinickia violacea TaxID=2571746 RepID=A0A4P8IJA9_9BURK|nr:hypothetical protein FAZ95_03030 [Trinickia violacea]